MKDPVISVSRAHKEVAVFDGLDLAFPFEPYADEAEAISVARSRVAQRTSKEPRVVFPEVTLMRAVRERRRRPRPQGAKSL